MTIAKDRYSGPTNNYAKEFSRRRTRGTPQRTNRISENAPVGHKNRRRLTNSLPGAPVQCLNRHHKGFPNSHWQGHRSGAKNATGAFASILGCESGPANTAGPMSLA